MPPRRGGGPRNLAVTSGEQDTFGPAMKSTLTLRLALLGVMLVASGCYQAPTSDHAILTVSQSGELNLQGRAVERQGLQAAIEAATAKNRTLVVEIHASPQAPVAVLEEVVGKAKAAHAVVAFAGETP